MAKYPCVIFASGGEGLGMQGIAVSVHQDFTSHSSVINELRAEWADTLTDVQSFLVCLKGDTQTKPFSLKPSVDILPTVVKKKL